jgi:hypothetical protein
MLNSHPECVLQVTAATDSGLISRLSRVDQENRVQKTLEGYPRELN